MTPLRTVTPTTDYAHRLGLVRYQREPDGTWTAAPEWLPGVTLKGREKADVRRGLVTLAGFGKPEPPDIVA